MKQTLSIFSFCLALYAAVPYIIDIVKRKTKPNIVTWFTWTLLTGIATAAAFAAGEPRSDIITLAISIQTGSIVLLGLKYGIAKMTWFDGLCQLGVIVALILWLLLNSPLIAIVGALIIDFIGLLPTAKHSYLKPTEETWES
ncbi:MAG: hypothetical protein ACXWLH_01535 [Candidatus Saccharimonadales bacterium]